MNILKTKNKKYVTILCIALLFAIIASLTCAFTFNAVPNMVNGGLIDAAEPTADIGNGGNSIYDPMQFMQNKYSGKKSLNISEIYSK